MFLFRTFIAGLASNYHDYLLEFKDAPPKLLETKPIPLCTIPTLENWVGTPNHLGGFPSCLMHAPYNCSHTSHPINLVCTQFIWEDFLVV